MLTMNDRTLEAPPEIVEINQDLIDAFSESVRLQAIRGDDFVDTDQPQAVASSKYKIDYPTGEVKRVNETGFDTVTFKAHVGELSESLNHVSSVTFGEIALGNFTMFTFSRGGGQDKRLGPVSAPYITEYSCGELITCRVADCEELSDLAYVINMIEGEDI